MKPRTKTYLTYAGIAAASAGGAYAVARWTQKPKQNLGFVFPFTDEAKIYDAAAAQVEKAQAGVPLSDYRQAEDVSLFWGGSPTDPIAYAKTAYWVALGARLEKNPTLANYARQLMDGANHFRLIPNSGGYTSNIEQIYANARQALQPYAASNEIRAILAALGAGASATAQARQAADDQSVASNTAAASASDVASLVAYGRGVVTGEKPAGYTDARWFFHKWGSRAALGLLAAGVVYGVWKWERIGERVSKVKSIAVNAISSARDAAMGEG
jgi:hypothetical protein